MNPYLIASLLIFILLLFTIAFYWFVIKKDSSSEPSLTCTNPLTNDPLPPIFVRPNCYYVQENTYDGTISSPPQPALLDFSLAQGTPGGALCDPLWYRFRYVRLSDGTYGPFGPWISSYVMSCANVLPYISTAQNPVTGAATCAFNQPTLTVTSEVPSPYNDPGQWVINVHRTTFCPTSTQLTPPDDSNDQVVGILYPAGNGGIFVDVFFPTNPVGAVCSGATC
jgi:hypothetical protein